MPHLAIEREVVIQRHDAAIDPRTHETLLAQVFEQVFVFAFLAANDGSEYGELGAGFERENSRDNLLAALSCNWALALRTMPAANPSIQHAQEIVDFGDRADGRTRIVTGRLLRNRNRRAQAADVVDIRLRHLPQELAGERREALYVPPLPFGKERVEREGAFARAGNTGQADQFIARKHNIDIAKVVLPSTFDEDICSGHQCADRFQSVFTRTPAPTR